MGPKKATPKPGTPKSAKKAATPKVKTPKATPKKATPKPVAKGVKRRASSVGGSGVQAKKMKIDTSRTPAKTPKTAKKSAKTPLDQLKNLLKKGHGPMWQRKLPLQRLKPALPARWPRMYKNNNDENLDKPCQLLEWMFPKTSTLPRCPKLVMLCHLMTLRYLRQRN